MKVAWAVWLVWAAVEAEAYPQVYEGVLLSHRVYPGERNTVHQPHHHGQIIGNEFDAQKIFREVTGSKSMVWEASPARSTPGQFIQSAVPANFRPHTNFISVNRQGLPDISEEHDSQEGDAFFIAGDDSGSQEFGRTIVTGTPSFPSFSTGSDELTAGPVVSTGGGGAALPAISTGGPVVTIGTQDTAILDVSSESLTGSAKTQGAALGGVGVPLPTVSTKYSSVSLGAPQPSTGSSEVSFSSGGSGSSLGSVGTQPSLASQTIQDSSESSSLLSSAPAKPTVSSNVLPQLLGMLINGQTNKISNPTQTLGSFLLGLNGKNGVVVLPESSLENVKNSGINVADRSAQSSLGLGTNAGDESAEGRDNTSDNVSDDIDDFVLQEDSSSAASDSSDSFDSLFPGGFPDLPSTTTEPPLFRGTVTDLLFSKGKLLGTIIGGIIDIGTTIVNSFSKIKPFA